MISTPAVLWWCARQELLMAIRSRWLHVFTLVFAGLALAVAGAGYVLSGGHGVQDFARTSASLVQLVVLLVPLAALVFGALALTPDRGAAELLYAQPVSRSAVLCGRVAGLWLALGAAQAIGFGVSGLVIEWQASSDSAWRYLALVATSLILTAVFLALAALIASTNVGRRTRVLALALGWWFVAVLLFDVVALGAASFLRSGPASRVLISAVLVNPVDAARVGVLMAIEGTSAFGAASLALLRFAGGPTAAAALIAASLAFWIVAPLTVAARRLARSDI
jgi:Cu-processing system permease protein